MPKRPEAAVLPSLDSVKLHGLSLSVHHWLLFGFAVIILEDPRLLHNFLHLSASLQEITQIFDYFALFQLKAN